MFRWLFPPLPPGLYIGGPPAIRWPPGITIKGRLPPWPTLTIPTKGPVPTAEKPSNCKTLSAEICSATTSYAGVVEGGTTRTTSSTTRETCATIYGCEVEDDATEIQTMSACTVAHAPAKPRAVVGTTTEPALSQHASPLSSSVIPPLLGRVPPPNPPNPCGIVGDAIIFPANPTDAAKIQILLENLMDPQRRPYWASTQEVKSARIAFTAFFYVRGFTQAYVNLILRQKHSYGVSRVCLLHYRSPHVHVFVDC